VSPPSVQGPRRTSAIRVCCRASPAVDGEGDVSLPAQATQRPLSRAEDPVEQTGSGRRMSDPTHQQGLEGERQVYSYRKLHDGLLSRRDQLCEPHRLAKLAGIRAQMGDERRLGSYGGKPSVVVNNTLARRFDVDAPDRTWVTDITTFGPRKALRIRRSWSTYSPRPRASSISSSASG